jgi:phosphonate transport system substrate-binding protein
MYLSKCKPIDHGDETPVIIDFSSIEMASPDQEENALPIINVAVSTIISPRETFMYYEELFEYISDKLNCRINFKQRKTYAEVNLLLENNEVDLAFICSGAYVVGKENSEIEILVVPICNGKPLYQSYIIINNTSTIEHFEDLQGKSFAFTDPLSNSGKYYAHQRVLKLNSTPELFFSKTMFTHAHDISMQLVSKRIVDGASVHGLIYEYLSIHEPDRVKNLKVIEKSDYFGMPPIVVPFGINDSLKTEFRNVFLTIHQDSIGEKILDCLLIDKFIEGSDENYNSVRALKQFITQ